jgi:hypothetical protein
MMKIARTFRKSGDENINHQLRFIVKQRFELTKQVTKPALNIRPEWQTRTNNWADTRKLD